MKWKTKIPAEKHSYVGTRTYTSWYNMKSRCNNPNYKNSIYWKGKGVTYPERWESFVNFLEDMGERPEETSLDRIDNSKGYSKNNCRWATRKQQMNNMRSNRVIEYNGESMNLNQWADRLGVKREVIRDRIDRYGWSIERAMNEPVTPNKKTTITIDGVSDNLTSWCRRLGVSRTHTERKIKRGMTPKEALGL